MLEEYKIELGAELKENALINIETKISDLRTRIQSNPIRIGINTSNITRQISSIKKQINELSNIKIVLSDGNGGGTRSINNIKTTTAAYKELKDIIREMGTIQTKIAGLNNNRNSSEITELNNQLDRLKEKYTNLRSTFDQSFDVGQLVGVETEMQKLANKVNLVNSRMADKSAANNQKTAIVEINAQYKQLLELQSQIGYKKIKRAGLNSETDAYQIQELSDQILQLTTDYNNLFDTANRNLSTNQLDNLTNGFDRINHSVDLINAKMADNSALQQQTEAYRELTSIASQMDKLELKIGGLRNSGGHENQINVLTQQLETLRFEYQSLMLTMQDSLSTQQLSNLGNSFAELQNKLAELDAKALDAQQNLFNTIKGDITEGTLNENVEALNARFTSLNTESNEVSNNIQKLKNLLGQMDSSDDIESVIDDYNEFNKLLTITDNKVKQLKRDQKESNNVTKNEQVVLRSDTLSNNIQSWLNDNKKAASRFGDELRDIQNQLHDNTDPELLRKAQLRFSQIKSEAKAAGLTVSSFTSSLKNVALQMVGITSTFAAIQKGVQTVKQMYDNVLTIDTAMTGLYRVTDLTGNQYEQLYDKMITSAKKYGATLGDVVDLTTSWVKLGFDADTSERLAEITTMYQNVTDIDTSTATKHIVTAYKGFEESLNAVYDGDASAAAEYIADIYDRLNNKFAVTASDIGESMQRSASALSMAGNTIQESTGMATGMIEVTQSAEKAGTVLTTTSLRLRGMKGELEELGEEIDENVESISQMQTHILNLTHGKVNIFKDNGDFKSTYQILKEISEIYNELKDTEQADLLETIAGKRNANGIAAIIKNWTQVESATETATNAAGTAAAENEKYMNSMQGKTDALIASWQALSNTFLSSDFLKGLIDSGNTALTILDDITDTLGTVPVLFGVISGALSGFKNIGRTKMFVLEINMPIVVIVLFRYEQFRYCGC